RSGTRRVPRPLLRALAALRLPLPGPGRAPSPGPEPLLARRQAARRGGDGAGGGGTRRTARLDQLLLSFGACPGAQPRDADGQGRTVRRLHRPGTGGGGLPPRPRAQPRRRPGGSRKRPPAAGLDRRDPRGPRSQACGKRAGQDRPRAGPDADRSRLLGRGRNVKQKTWTARKEDLKGDWYLVDATGVALGRLASSVAGMLQRNTLGADMLKRLRVYAGPNHGHQAQQPKAVTFNAKGDLELG